MTTPAQPAGWYADPSGLPATRWWDGRAWTDHVQPGGAVRPPAGGLYGYYPTAAPSGPATPGPHTVPVTDPESAEIFAARASGARSPGVVSRGGALPAPPEEHFTYAMPPVDAVAPVVADSAVTEQPPPARGLLRSPLLLSSVAVIVLAVIAAVMLLR
ncbi:DUF2510 domain-containing protein [Actinoplanes sp. NPDC051851]|uniref:DUF2510 domain-containing protein n=1 Tax=Actinoplanes sp. NPDC051851 TaxID=3154753 RepID=UPI00343AAE9C